MRRALRGEAIGTFFLIAAGCTANIVNGMAPSGTIGSLGIALTWGLLVMALIYALGPVSGAHFNPAVTLAFAVTGRFPWRCVAGYLYAQLAGAAFAGGLLRLFFSPSQCLLGATLPGAPALPALGMELFLAALLAFVIMAVSTGPREQGLMAGVAVGAVIALEIAAAGSFSGASMNPLRSAAPALASGDPAAIGWLWLYLAGPVAGAIFGALLHDRCFGAGEPAPPVCCPDP
jgi:MIP family channel proteins